MKTKKNKTNNNKTIKNEKNKNCIVNLLFGSEMYLIGSCISGYIHQTFRKKYKLSFDLILMVDEKMFSYKDILEKYYDKIMLVDIISIKLNPEYIKRIPEKYSETMNKFTTKVNIFKLFMYEKVLFLDIDILPINKNFYSIFEYNTPATTLGTPKDFNSKHTVYNLNNIYKIYHTDYSKLSEQIKLSINGGLFMISPKKDDFKNILNFISISEGKKGYTSHISSGPDETIILNYLMTQKKEKITNIPPYFSYIPWNNLYGLKMNDIYSYNFLSNVKPWNKVLAVMWKEESFFQELINKIIKKDKTNLLKIIQNINYLKVLNNFEKKIKNTSISARCIRKPNVIDVCNKAFEIIKNEKIQNLLKYVNKKDEYEKLNKDKAVLLLINKIIELLNDEKYFKFEDYGIIDENIKKMLKIIK